MDSEQLGCIEESPYASVLMCTFPLPGPARRALFTGRDEEVYRGDYLLRYCSHCFKPAVDQRCGLCRVVRYCDSTCAMKDVLAHKFECLAMQRSESALWLLHDHRVRLIGRIISRVMLDEGQPHAPEETFYGAKPFTLSDVLAGVSCRLRRDAQYELTETKTLIAFELFYRHLFPENVVGGQRWIQSVRDLIAIVESHAFGICRCFPLSSDVTPIGVGLYLNATRFKHSCAPSLIRSFNGTVMRLLPAPDLPTAGLEIDDFTIDYAPHYVASKDSFEAFGITLPEERRPVLEEFYMFTCHCSACDDDKKASIMRNSLSTAACGGLCQTCSQKGNVDAAVYVMMDSGEGVQCAGCGTVYCKGDKARAAKSAQEIVAKVKELLATYSQAYYDEGAIEAAFMAVLPLAKAVLHPMRNVYLLRLNLSMFKLWACRTRRSGRGHTQRARKMALQFGDAALRSLEQWVPPYSMLLAFHYAEIGGVLLLDGQNFKAEKWFRKARAVWTMRVGTSEHPTVKELENVRMVELPDDDEGEELELDRVRRVLLERMATSPRQPVPAMLTN